MASNHSNQWFDGLNPIPIPTWSLTVRPWKVTKGPKRKPDRLPVPSWFSVAFAVQLRECVFLDWIGENRGFTSDPLGFTSVIPRHTPRAAGRVFYLELPCVRSSPVQLMAPWCERPNHDGIGWPNTQCMVYYIYLHLITVLFMVNECYIPYIECLGCWFNKTCRLFCLIIFLPSSTAFQLKKKSLLQVVQILEYSRIDRVHTILTMAIGDHTLSVATWLSLFLLCRVVEGWTSHVLNSISQSLIVNDEWE